ncbi:MAG TPA: glycosyltransferase family A protein [Bacilli bacterium]|nr:glycosyltransferase family A protein [Bacilli bacterium]
MELTVAIVCSKDILLARCLKSIPKKYPVLVVLNYPSNEVINIIKQDKRAETIRHDEANLGLLRQLAAEKVKTKGIMYLDSDCVIEEGTIDKVASELDKFPAVSIPMKYKYHNFSTKIVARCREFTTPAEALFMPMAFSIDVQKKIGGYLYDKRLLWGEDSDQRQRIIENNISFTISKGCVWHEALNFRSDSRSAIRLGRGRYIQEQHGYYQKRKLLKDLLPFNKIPVTIKCIKKIGFLATLYHDLVWRPSYKYGYWKEVVKNGRKNRA